MRSLANKLNLSRMCMLVALALAGCATAGEAEPDWSFGTDEPDYEQKNDGSTPLTIYLSREQPTIRKFLADEEMGNLVRSRTGILNLDGSSLTAETVVIFDGTLWAYDGSVEDYRIAVSPRYVSHEEGANNVGGFLRIDLKSASKVKVLRAPEGKRLGDTAGVFRGRIIATTAVTLDGQFAEDLSEYYIEPARYNQRVPNLLRTDIQIRPNVALTTLKPRIQCFGKNVVDTTLAGTTLAVGVALDGFPLNKDIQVNIRYRYPHSAAETVAGHLWDYVSGIFADDVDEIVVSKIVRAHAPRTFHVSLEDYVTLHPEWGSDLYAMEIEVEARMASGSGAFSGPYSHRLTVVQPNEEVIVDQFDLCPVGDEQCLSLRDAFAPDNVVARRRIVEESAAQQGLYDTVTRSVSRCAGGDRIAGSFADSCTVYRESTDSRVQASVASELNFELNVNGQARGSASWAGGIPGLGSADVQAAFKAAFKLDVALDASFSTSRTWASHSSLDVLYDPSNTQIQWWRVVTPRLRYLEIAEFDACGARLGSHELYLSDLSDSRLVLACEAVPSFDTVCHAVEPTSETVSACNELLISPTSERGVMCLAEDDE